MTVFLLHVVSGDLAFLGMLALLLTPAWLTQENETSKFTFFAFFFLAEEREVASFNGQEEWRNHKYWEKNEQSGGPGKP